MLGRIFDQAFRHLMTLSLIAAVSFVPLHVAYWLVFRDVIAVIDLHGVIENLASGDSIVGVDAGDLRTARVAAIALGVVELISLPFLARVAARALDDEDEGRVATVRTAFGALRRGTRRTSAAPLPLAIAIAFGLVTWWLTETSLISFTRWVPVHMRGLVFTLAQAVPRCLGAAFALSALAVPPDQSRSTPAKRSSSGSLTGTRDSTSV